jgi:hypothetical protein
MARQKIVFVPNPAGQTYVLRSPSGPVGKHMLRLGNETQRYARDLVGKKTGGLSRSISVRLGSNSQGLTVRIGSDKPHALLHHEGTIPHIILPKNASVLAFRVGGNMVFARKVRHPGTRANPYLVIAMSWAIGRTR